MAIGVGSIVALDFRDVAASGANWRAEPLFGLVIGGSDPWDILWETGRQTSSGIAGTLLSEITPQSVEPRVVRVGTAVPALTGYQDGIVVAGYLRDQTAYLLVRLINAPGQLVETPASQVEDQTDR